MSTLFLRGGEAGAGSSSEPEGRGIIFRKTCNCNIYKLGGALGDVSLESRIRR
jgi:hypothetical protein